MTDEDRDEARASAAAAEAAEVLRAASALLREVPGSVPSFVRSLGPEAQAIAFRELVVLAHGDPGARVGEHGGLVRSLMRMLDEEGREAFGDLLTDLSVRAAWEAVDPSVSEDAPSVAPPPRSAKRRAKRKGARKKKQ